MPNYKKCVLSTLAILMTTFLLSQPIFGQEAPIQVRYRPEVTDMSGNPLSSIGPMETFTFNLYVQDVGPDPQGAFAAYADVVYDASLFATVGDATHYEPYINAPLAILTTPGLIDEAGGVDGITPLGGDEFRLLSVPMTSLGSAGTGIFQTDPVEAVSLRATVLYGQNREIPTNEIEFMSTSLTVVPEPTGLALLSTIALVAIGSSRRRKRHGKH